MVTTSKELEAKNEFEYTNQDTDLPIRGLGTICVKPDGTTVLGAMGKDRGTLERRLLLIVVNKDKESSPLQEFLLSRQKDLNNLRDLDGISSDEDIKAIIACINEHKKQGTLKTIDLGSEKPTVQEAYKALVEYVNKYYEPEKVFISEGYGNIASSYLNTVISKLELGYSRLELLKNLKVRELLRCNADGAAHMYSYKIKKAWYCSFLLPSEKEGGKA